MTIEEVPDVVIDERGGYKFIVAVVTNSDNKQKTVIRANEKCDYHKRILAQLQNEIYIFGLKAKCIGGGQIRVSPNEKTITIWDYSGDYGLEPNRNETALMLRVAFPDWTIKIGPKY